MKKTILKSALASLILAVPAVAFAQMGLVGDCYDCHTMHNSEGGHPVAVVDGAISHDPIQNLLRLDCIACHANDPTAGTKLWTMSGGSVVPQVMHGGGTDDLAGGNFAFGAGGDMGKVHNVVDLFTQLGSTWEDNAGDPLDTGEFGAPPGTAPAAHYHGFSRGVFTVNFSTPFDAFTCAGARGCHGTRSQMLTGDTIDDDGNTATANVFVGQRRTGIAAISGSHHNSYDGAKDATNYPADETAFHDGQRVADGYRFIPGLKGYGNEGSRWENVDATSHNEYYGNDAGTFGLAPEPTSGCGICHIEGHAGGYNSRAAINSTLRVPGNSMSGFCSTCHGTFHSSGGAGDYAALGPAHNEHSNGVSGAFLRHPSDYVIPEDGEYAAYDTYVLSAPVARPTLYTAASDVVTGDVDMVMCLSCHESHGSQYDYMLRFPYRDIAGVMNAGGYGDITTAQSVGGCLACHTTKGVLPANR
jgi:predicted CXXCH cytochrome family protein